MASLSSQLIEEVTAHAQRDSLEDAREICADGTYFPNNLRTNKCTLSQYGVSTIEALELRHDSIFVYHPPGVYINICI